MVRVEGLEVDNCISVSFLLELFRHNEWYLGSRTELRF